MNELALFAGVGGGILGGHLLGWRTVAAVEIADYPRRVLLQRQADGLLPRFPIWDDICTFDGKPWRTKVDVITGGFSHAKTFQLAEKVMDLKEKGPDCGERWQGLLAKFDPITSLWKTPQCSLLEDLEQFLETWSNWGLMLNGVCWEETTPNYLIEENEFGCWLPTMTVSMKNGCSSKRYLNSKEYRGSMPMEWIRTSPDCAQYFHPDYAELLMDFPIKWTDLKPLEMDKFQSWQQQHGESLQKDN
jgi:DNA (cytosine-5)-methyltransferase 1